jgi:hypothetical protein
VLAACATSLNFYQIKWCNNLEDSHLCTCFHETSNLKVQMFRLPLCVYITVCTFAFILLTLCVNYTINVLFCFLQPDFLSSQKSVTSCQHIHMSQYTYLKYCICFFFIYNRSRSPELSFKIHRKFTTHQLRNTALDDI